MRTGESGLIEVLEVGAGARHDAVEVIAARQRARLGRRRCLPNKLFAHAHVFVQATAVHRHSCFTRTVEKPTDSLFDPLGILRLISSDSYVRVRVF